MVREALDDIRRYRRDREVNAQLYKKLTLSGEAFIPSSDITVGDLIIVEKVSDYSQSYHICAERYNSVILMPIDFKAPR